MSTRVQYCYWQVSLLAIAVTYIASFYFSFYAGMSYDEELAYSGFRGQIHHAIQALSGNNPRFEDIPANIEYYGIGPKIIAYVIFITIPRITYYHSFHITSLLFGIAGCFIFYKVASLYTSQKIIVYSSTLAFSIYPVWVGLSLMNIKDIPTATAFLIILYGSLRSLAKGVDRASILSVFAGAVLLGSIKLVAIITSIPLLAVFSFTFLRSNAVTNGILKLTVFWLSVFIGIYLLTPAMWLEPFRYIQEHFSLMARHVWGGCSLSFGECISTKSPQWSSVLYLLKWYSVKMPLAIIAGLFIYIVTFSKCKNYKLESLLVISLLFPIFLIVMKNSTIYNGIRHTIFLVPLIFLVSFKGIENIFLVLAEKGKRVLVAFLASFSIMLVIDNLSLLPYNYVYFNILARQIANHKTFDLDYWGFSRGETARVFDSLHQEEHLRLVGHKDLDDPFTRYSTIRNPDEWRDYGLEHYVIESPRGENSLPQNCVIQYTTRRKLFLSVQNLVLSRILYCFARDERD